MTPYACPLTCTTSAASPPLRSGDAPLEGLALASPPSPTPLTLPFLSPCSSASLSVALCCLCLRLLPHRSLSCISSSVREMLLKRRLTFVVWRQAWTQPPMAQKLYDACIVAHTWRVQQDSAMHSDYNQLHQSHWVKAVSAAMFFSGLC